MKEVLLALNASYFLFGATLYCGVMWALVFFFYPSWETMELDDVQDHFIIPTSAATRFFTVVVPLMFLSGIVLLVTEWGDGDTFWAAVLAMLGIIASTFVGQVYIIPINKRIKAGVPDNATLIPLLRQWMRLNGIRWVTSTAMWAAMVWYFISKGDLLDALK